MSIFDILETRRSIRQYQDTPVEPEKLRRILEAMRLCPSARNMQDWKFFAVTDPAVKEKIAAAPGASPAMIAGAPVVLVAAGNNDRVMNCGHRCCSVDLTIAMTAGVLAATELGLGSCLVGSHNEEAVREALGLPEGWHVPLISPLGYPAESPAPRPRKAFDEVAEIR